MTPMKPVSLKRVDIRDRFWSERQKLIRETVIPYQWDALNDDIPGAEPSHTIPNFRIAAGELDDDFHGMVFQDSDLAKWLETVGFALSVQRDEKLEAMADEVIGLIERAQQDDGYLNTYFTVAKPDERWTNLRDLHELYCAGHMIEAAVAYYEATGKAQLLDVVCRLVDHIASVFGPEPGKKRGYPGHPEIELALVKLYRVTRNKKYLDLSRFFIDERGQKPHYFDIEAEARDHRKEYWTTYEYCQAHLPVREQKTAEGHAVRAMYLYSGMTDIATEFADESLFSVCRQLWENVTKRRMYVTGGVGSSSYGEAFTVDYDLPNDRAYTETCAAIGLVFWAHRMLQLDPDRDYADVMERALYNGVLSGMSLDGKSYFYVNPLEVWPATANTRHDMASVKTTRQPWFGCACCPPNLARLLASLGQYIYSYRDPGEELFVHLYIGSEVELTVREQQVKLTQQTNYPWDGEIELTISTERELAFTLALRLPGWCHNATVSVNGEEINAAPCTTKGYTKIRRTWQDGDRIRLSLRMPVERIWANPRVRENSGKVALQQGPVVFCLEEVDNGENLRDIRLSPTAELSSRFEEQLLGGVSVITGPAWRSDTAGIDDRLYTSGDFKKKPITFKAVPYFAWCNRQPGEMLVWIREG